MREIKGATRVGWDLEMPTPPGNGPPSHTKLINPLERERERMDNLLQSCNSHTSMGP